MKISHFFKKKTVHAPATSDFSRFFREASSGEKKQIFKEIAHRATEDQRRVMEETYKVTTTTN